MRRILFTAAVAAAVAIPLFAGAQTWRTIDASRPAHDTSALAVHVMYGAGRVRVEPAADQTLYGMHLRYDAERAEPVYKFDGAARTLDVGVRHTTSGRHMGGEGSELRLQLSKTTPLHLTLDVGAAEGDYDLSGLGIEQLSVETGATDSRLRFDTPNPRRMQSANFQVGAASLEVTGLGNANVRNIELNLGVGGATFDFGGAWTGDIDMTVNSALGKVTLRVPNDVGIRVESSAFLHSLDAPGLVKRSGHLVSPNWDTAKYKLQVRSSGAFGQLDIQRIAR